MSKRVLNIIEHMKYSHSEKRELKDLKQRVALAALTSQFTLSRERLQEMAYFMIHEMHEGLAGRTSTLRMLPSFVYKRDTRQVDGIFYALDLGGTNFRVIRMELREGALFHAAASKFTIPDEHVKGTADGLFGFIADSVRTFIDKKYPKDNEKGTRNIPLGFTFSFPVQQQTINKGHLIKWTKRFTTSGVEGNNVVDLLQKSLDKRAVNMKVTALCNDTVGTLIARYFRDPHTQMGVILGTGANACYWERSSNVTKDRDVAKNGDVQTIINMEFGNFDSFHTHTLKVTDYDNGIDKASENPGEQRFEKMISGMYLGEIARRCIVALSHSNLLSKSLGERLVKPYSFETKDLAEVSADRLPGLNFTRQHLQTRFGIDVEDKYELWVVRNVCVLVRNRAAQLAGMAIAATLLKAEQTGNATVAVDGSVYEKTPSFKTILQTTINCILGPEADVRLVLQNEGSGHGAGFIAALSAL